MDIATEVQNVTKNAQAIRNDDPKTFGSEWMPGDCSAQGDVNIVCIHALPKSAKPRKNRQMADGNTMGSRHIVEGGKCYDADPADVAEAIYKATGVKIDPKYIVPMFVVPCELDHVEHGNQVWSAPCTNAIVYQRIWDQEMAQERRARD